MFNTGIYYDAQGTRHEVQISSELEGLTVTSPHFTFLWPYTDLGFDWGGDETALIEVKCQAETVYLHHISVLEQSQAYFSAQQVKQLKRIQDKLKSGRRTKNLLLALTFSACLIVVCFWLGVQALSWGRKTVLSHLPLEWERQLGAQAFQEISKESPVCSQPALKAGVKEIEQRLEKTAASRYDLEYVVVRSETLNAFALPGGKIAIHAALIAQAPSAEALAGVMAHEAEHVLQQHGLSSLITKMSMGIVVPVIFGDMGSVMVSLGAAGAGLINLTFSRQHESEADRLGLELLHSAHINPSGMAEFFDWMTQQEEGIQVPAFLSTHPLSKKRARILEQAIGALPQASYRPLKLDWSAMQAAAKECLQD